MPVGFSATVNRARIAQETTSVGESVTVTKLRNKDLVVAENLVPTLKKDLNVSRGLITVPLVPVLKKQLRRDNNLIVTFVPSFLAGRFVAEVLAMTVKIGRQTNSIILSATEAFTATLTTIRFANKTLTPGTVLAPSLQKRPNKLFNISGLSMILPPIVSGVGMAVDLTKTLIGFKIKNLSTTVGQTATVGTRRSFTLSTSSAITTNLTKRINKALAATVGSAVTLTSMKAAILSVVKIFTPTVIKQLLQSSNTLSTTIPTSAVVEKRAMRKFTASVGSIPSLLAQKIVAIENFTTTTVSSVSLKKDVFKNLLTDADFISATLRLSILTNLSATVSESVVLQRMVSKFVTVFTILQPRVNSLVNFTLRAQTTIVTVVLKTPQKILTTTPVGISILLRINSTTSLILSATTTIVATVRFSRGVIITAILNTPVVALLKRIGKKLVTSTHPVAHVIRIPILIIGIPGQVVLRNISSFYIYLKNESPLSIILRSFFNG